MTATLLNCSKLNSVAIIRRCNLCDGRGWYWAKNVIKPNGQVGQDYNASPFDNNAHQETCALCNGKGSFD